MKLRILPEALARIDAARAWWIGNREKVPELFDDELAAVLEQIATAPFAGQRVSLSRGRGVRRALMQKSGFHVYYDVVEEEIHILTIWGAVRGSGPTLG